MKDTVLDLQALKTFVLGIEFKSFALAAKHQHKSTSAVSAHLKKLEMQTNSTLVKKEGRYLLPTEQGEQLLRFAKNMLAMNDEALETIRCIDLQGSVSVGLQEDFAEAILTECLGRFTRVNEHVQLNTMIERYTKLISAIQEGALDLSVTWQGNETTPYSDIIAHTPIQWISSPSFPLENFLEQNLPLPLVMVEPNCLFKKKATDALDSAGIKWKIVYQSQSLSGIWPAVQAGLGVTARTTIGRPDSLKIIQAGLPKMDEIGIQVHRAQDAGNKVQERLADLMTKTIQRNYV